MQMNACKFRFIHKNICIYIHIYTLIHIFSTFQSKLAKIENRIKKEVNNFKMFPNSSSFQFKDWYIEAAKGPILASKGDVREKYERDILLPHLPDMLFANNHLKLTHKKGFGIHFKGILFLNF